MGEPNTRRDLRTLLKWCRLQADEPDADPLWRKLADEIDAYLTDEEQTPPAAEKVLF